MAWIKKTWEKVDIESQGCGRIIIIGFIVLYEVWVLAQLVYARWIER